MNGGEMKITIAAAAEFLECSEVRVHDLLREGALPGLKMGKAWVIPSEPFYRAVEALAASEADILARQHIAHRPGPIPVKLAVGRPRLFRSE